MREQLCGHTSVHSVLMLSTVLLTPMCRVHGWIETDTWEEDEIGKQERKDHVETERGVSYFLINVVTLLFITAWLKLSHIKQRKETRGR